MHEDGTDVVCNSEETHQGAHVYKGDPSSRSQAMEQPIFDVEPSPRFPVRLRRFPLPASRAES